MEKIKFYTQVLKSNKLKGVELQEGYTDGNFNYYKSRCGIWAAIVPSCGVSICEGATLSEVQAGAYAPDVPERIKRGLEKNPKLISDFELMKSHKDFVMLI